VNTKKHWHLVPSLDLCTILAAQYVMSYYIISRGMDSFCIPLWVEEEMWNSAGYIYTEHESCIFLRIIGKLFIRIDILTCHNTIIFYRLTIDYVPILKDICYRISVSSHVITAYVTKGFHGSNIRTICPEQYSAYRKNYTKFIFLRVYSLRLRHMAHLNQLALNC
jgi:hypothetical protein